jgi:hypothetical protein
MKPSLAAGLLASALFAASGAASSHCTSPPPAHSTAGIARNIKVPVMPGSQPITQCHYSAQ